MKFDVFFSICQTDVDGQMPSERVMFENFFDQLATADDLGYETAWVAETHLSCEVQKLGPMPVTPHFKGEIGLNTDILQLAHLGFSKTKQIKIGSAIRNILCNGGPIAHAEAVRTFLTFRNLLGDERILELGFAAGRFEFSNRPYGIKPRNDWERKAWSVVKGKIFLEATEIFLRLLKGEVLSRSDLPLQKISAKDFRTPADFEAVQKIAGPSTEFIQLKPFFDFEKLGVIPRSVDLTTLNLTIGSHDPAAQILANQILPCGVFNLSITPPKVLEETHERLRAVHPHWRRDLMPRTAMVFLDATPGFSGEARTEKAKAQAHRAWENYWRAMEGTLDTAKVNEAVANTLAGDPKTLVEQIRAKYHPEDRLMLWFDFNNHDNDAIKKSMRIFKEEVAPQLERFV